ncbi:cilia- and flagella-associated protein 251-like [Phoenix dactylifera]|uniref:Cilia- and flagella-associated protein 251-like n=1 Tax=Phoenix dactylifera TaxID=42345 RepID=A0A8B8ZC14_PHODC|nr:cilia- and flagella-associated protein 251-like [Phoenix dactylifera]
MMRQVSSRNQRSKGLRVKNILQLCLLAAVCFWLVYQLKHSYNKKRALEERNLKASEKIVESQLEFLKLGRKDLSRGEENSSGNGIHDKEEGNEEVEEEEEDREVKQAMEDEEAGGDGDDEIDEQDQERDDEQEDQERADEEAENGELTNEEDKDGQGEETQPLDDQDPEEDSSHKAREESYKRDDVSSAVRRENQAKNSDDEDGDAGEEVMENTEEKYVDADDMADGADDASKTNSDLSVRVADVSKDNIMGVVLAGSKTNRDDYPTTNRTVIEKKGSKFGFNNSEGSPRSNQRELQTNSTTSSATSNHVEAHANSTSAVSNNQTETQTSSTVSDAVPDSVLLENETFGRDSVPKHSIMENSEGNKINLKNVMMEGLAERSNTTVGREDAGEHSSMSLGTHNSGDPIQGEFTESLHKMVTEEERDARIDLSTLRAMQNEVKSMADEAAK